MDLHKKWNKSKISGKTLHFPICPKQNTNLLQNNFKCWNDFTNSYKFAQDRLHILQFFCRIFSLLLR